MRIGELPFLLVFLSSLMPITSSFFGVSLYHLPAFLVLAILALMFASSRQLFTDVNDKKLVQAIFLMGFLLMIQIFTGRGFVLLGAGGYLFIFTAIFYGLFISGSAISSDLMIRRISFLYKFFVVGMMIETVIVLLGQQSLLEKLFYPIYKTYNPADVLRLFGLFQNSGGINSILLGSQIAGMLSLFAVIWFWSVRRITTRKAEGHISFWLAISFLMLIISINGTVLLLLVLSAMLYGFFIKPKNRVFFSAVICSLCVGLYFLIANGLLLQRIFSTDLIKLSSKQSEVYAAYGVLNQLEGVNTMGFYAFQLFNPVIVWASLDWFDRLLGAGAQFFLEAKQYISGDFGFGADVLLKAGLLWAVIFVVTLFRICIPLLKPSARASCDRQAVIWGNFGSVHALISILWLVSLVHYNQALGNAGGEMLFALHLALALLSRRRARGIG